MTCPLPCRQLGVQRVGPAGFGQLGCRERNAPLFLKFLLPFTFFLSLPLPLGEVRAALGLLQDLAELVIERGPGKPVLDGAIHPIMK